MHLPQWVRREPAAKPADYWFRGLVPRIEFAKRRATHRRPVRTLHILYVCVTSRLTMVYIQPHSVGCIFSMHRPPGFSTERRGTQPEAIKRFACECLSSTQTPSSALSRDQILTYSVHLPHIEHYWPGLHLACNWHRLARWNWGVKHDKIQCVPVAGGQTALGEATRHLGQYGGGSAVRHQLVGFPLGSSPWTSYHQSGRKYEFRPPSAKKVAPEGPEYPGRT